MTQPLGIAPSQNRPTHPSSRFERGRGGSEGAGQRYPPTLRSEGRWVSGRL